MQVRSFTALIILINIDNILAPSAGIIFGKLRIFEHKSIFTKEDVCNHDDKKDPEKLGNKSPFKEAFI